MKKTKFLIFILVAFTISACLPDSIDSDLTKLNNEQAKIIESYLSKNNLTATREELFNYRGDKYPIYTMIDIPGDGSQVLNDPNDAIWVSYTIRDLQNVEWSSATQQDSVLIYPNGFSGKILGLSWCASEFLGTGGKGTFFVPSNLGYGNMPPAGKEENAILIIDLQVHGRFSQENQVAWFAARKGLNNLTTTESGLMFEKTKAIPEGLETPASTKVKYVGQFLNEFVFDSNDQGVQFDLDGVVPGFAEAIRLMQTGEKAVAILPASIAYGINGDQYGRIPGNKTIAFEIEIIP